MIKFLEPRTFALVRARNIARKAESLSYLTTPKLNGATGKKFIKLVESHCGETSSSQNSYASVRRY